MPATPVNDLSQVWGLPPLVQRGILSKVSHPTIGELPIVGSPLTWEGAGRAVSRHPPLLGEHKEEVLRELGYSPEEISRLSARGVI